MAIGDYFIKDNINLSLFKLHNTLSLIYIYISGMMYYQRSYQILATTLV